MSDVSIVCVLAVLWRHGDGDDIVFHVLSRFYFIVWLLNRIRTHPSFFSRRGFVCYAYICSCLQSLIQQVRAVSTISVLRDSFASSFLRTAGGVNRAGHLDKIGHSSQAAGTPDKHFG